MKKRTCYFCKTKTVQWARMLQSIALCCTLIKMSGSKVWSLEANYKPGLLALDEMPPRV